MKPELYRKIFKVLNEDLSMILPDDEFEERIPNMKIHMGNTQRTVYINYLRTQIDKAIEAEDRALLKDIIENQWDGEIAFYPVSNNNIQDIIIMSTHALGKNGNLNWMDVSNITNM